MGGGPMSQLQSQQQTPMGGGTSPLNTGGGMSGGQTSSPTNFGPMVNYGQGNGGGFGGQQMPNFAGPQQQPASSMVAEEYPTQSFGDMQYRPQQQPEMMMSDMQYRPERQPMQQPAQQGQSIPSVFTPDQFKPYANAPRTREEQHRFALERGQIGNPGDKYLQQPQYQQPFGGFYGQQPQPMQNPFQPQQPSFMQNPEYQGYQTQAQNLSRQMDEYMKKAPMYQQLQDLQNKMAPFQQRHQQQEMQRMQQMQQAQMQRYQQPSPFRRGQFQQPMGLMGLMGGRGGMQQPRMSMDMPYARGFASELPTYFMKKGGKV